MATTKENVRVKVVELLNDIKPILETKLDILLDSGAIDFEKEDDTWALPKDIMQALAKEMAWQYKHPHPPYGYKKRIENFYRNM
jgi:hypothetical protein